VVGEQDNFKFKNKFLNISKCYFFHKIVIFYKYIIFEYYYNVMNDKLKFFLI